ncbi:thrombospondin-1, partial [Elysia marginata]
AANIKGTISPETAGSTRNLAIPPHLQGKKAPGNHGDLAQAQNSPSRLSGKSTPTSQGLPSPGKLSKGSSKASRSNLSSSLASPTRSLHSEVEGLELEYDDFIEDDPLSYFDYEETMKLTFRGKERIGKSPVDEEEEDEENAGEQTKIK